MPNLIILQTFMKNTKEADESSPILKDISRMKLNCRLLLGVKWNIGLFGLRSKNYFCF